MVSKTTSNASSSAHQKNLTKPPSGRLDNLPCNRWSGGLVFLASTWGAAQVWAPFSPYGWATRGVVATRAANLHENNTRAMHRNIISQLNILPMKRKWYKDGMWNLTRNGNFSVRLTSDGHRVVVHVVIRTCRSCTSLVHSQMLQVAIIPRHFAVDTTTAFYKVTTHQESVVGVAQPVRIGRRLATWSRSVQCGRIFLDIQWRCTERAAPLNSACALLPI